MKILHITAHIGGGICSALAGLGTCGHEQSVLLLEEPLNLTAVNKVKAAGFHILKGLDNAATEEAMRQADVIVFSWFHHPALTRFLHDLPQIPMRSVLWCHVSGNYFPSIPAELLLKFDQVMFTAPFSLDLPQIRQLGESYIKDHFSVVYGINDLTRFFQLERKQTSNFTVGYVGTLGFCKLHPDFVDFCAAVDMPDVIFKMVGTPSTKEQIMSQAAQYGIAGQIQFCGYMPDVTEALSQMDVFSYLLNPQHFASTDNAFVEAMAAGVPIIALDQCAERHIIKDNKTGLLVRSPEEYGNAVRYLRENPKKAEALGAAAREDVMKRFNLQNNTDKFIKVCEETLHTDKHICTFDDFFYGEPSDWFLSCVKDDRECFEKNQLQTVGQIFYEKTKGSPVHYHTYFPEDQRLASWAAQIESMVL